MKHFTALIALIVAHVALAAPATQPAPKRIEVCFVLDTTGSMGSLIDGAKQKIWSIANAIITTPTGGGVKPQVKLALVAYRDRGDKYITEKHDLTDDIDTVFKNLSAFTADGGGDGPESVNQALAEAVNDISWSKDNAVTRIIFLVGDAPPHMDYKDDVKYPQTCAAAKEKGLIMNAVQCGNEGDTTPIWKEIATAAAGSYIPLGQTGDMVVIKTPYDEDLAKLSMSINSTVCAYGSFGVQKEVAMKISGGTVAATAPVAAERVAFFARSGSGKAIGGDGDLVDAIKSKSIRWDDVKEADLPEDMKKLTPEQRKVEIDRRIKEREVLQAKVADLASKRSAFIAEEHRKQAATRPAADAFDEQVAKVCQEQMQRAH